MAPRGAGGHVRRREVRQEIGRFARGLQPVGEGRPGAAAPPGSETQVQAGVGPVEFDVGKGIVEIIQIQFDGAITDVHTDTPG